MLRFAAQNRTIGAVGCLKDKPVPIQDKTLARCKRVKKRKNELKTRNDCCAWYVQFPSV